MASGGWESWRSTLPASGCCCGGSSAPFILPTPRAHLRVRWVSSRLVGRRMAARSVPLVRWPCLLNAAELAGLIAFPMGDVLVSGLSLGAAKQLPPPAEMPRTGSVLARDPGPQPGYA